MPSTAESSIYGMMVLKVSGTADAKSSGTAEVTFARHALSGPFAHAGTGQSSISINAFSPTKLTILPVDDRRAPTFTPKKARPLGPEITLLF